MAADALSEPISTIDSPKFKVNLARLFNRFVNVNSRNPLVETDTHTRHELISVSRYPSRFICLFRKLCCNQLENNSSRDPIDISRFVA